MHLFRTMSRRSHRSLRLGALALLAAMAIWPRTKAATTAAELSQGPHAAARAETTAAKLVSPPRTAKLTVAEADESQLSN